MSVAIVRAIAHALKNRGVSVRELCTAAGIEREQLEDAGAMLPVDTYDRVARTAIELSGDPAFGLHVGEAAPTAALHAVGYLLLNCATIRDAISQFVRLAGLVFESAQWDLTEQGDHARFGYRHELVAPDVASFDAEFVLAFVFGVSRHYTGRDDGPLEVRFMHAQPAHVAEYERVFRCPLVFGAPRNELVFKRFALDIPQLHRDESLAALLRDRAERMLADRQSDDVLRQRVIDIIKLQPRIDSVDTNQIARQLGVSARTLRRRLAAIDATPSTLADAARCEIARSALIGSTPIKEIAARLGYSEPSAFHRAFKRWTGMTPSRYRAMAARGGAVDSGRRVG